MFEDLDDKLELDLFNKTAPDDFVEDSTENKYANKKKMSDVSTIVRNLKEFDCFQVIPLTMGFK